jgi:hypothetical protein
MKIHIVLRKKPLCGQRTVEHKSVHINYWAESFNQEDICERCKRYAIARKAQRDKKAKLARR